MADNRVVTELIVDGRQAAAGFKQFSDGADKAGQAANKAAVDIGKFAPAATNAGQAAEVVSQKFSGVGTSTATLERRLERLQAQLDPTYAAKLKVAKGAELLDAGFRRGVISAAELEQRSAQLAQRWNIAAGGASAFKASNDNLTRSAGLARHEMVNLGRQAQDVATQLAMGQSVMQVVAAQGAQIADVFASSNGTLRGFAGQIAEMITPARVAVVGLGAGVVTAALAMNSWADDQRELQRQLAGTGRDSGLTAKRVNEMADAVARLNGMTTGQARQTLGALANTGRIDPAYLQRIASVTKDVAATLAIDVKGATSLLASAFADPIEGAEELNRRLGGLTNATRQQIASLVSAGREGDAYNVMLATFQPRLERASDLTSTWAQAWEKVAYWASRARDAAGKAADPASVSFEDQARERLRQLELQAKNDDRVYDRTNGRELGSRYGAFGETQEDLQRRMQAELEGRKKINAELEIQRAAIHAITVGQQALTEATYSETRQRLVNERSVSDARQLGLQPQLQAEGLNRLADAYKNMRNERINAYDRQGEEGGFERYRRALEQERSIRRSLNDSVSNRDGMWGRDGELLLSNNQLLERRISLQDQAIRRHEVDRQGLTAVTAGEQAAAAAARSRQQAREQGPSAGSPELVDLNARNAASLVLLGLTHQLRQAAQDRVRQGLLQVDAIRAETAALGGSVGEQERVRTEMQLINQAKAEYGRLGLSVPPAEIAAYRELAKAIGEARQQQAELKAVRDIAFERQLIGLSDGDQTIARNFRGIYGDDGWRAQMGNATAQAARFNDQLKQSVDLSRGFGADLLSGLREGKNGFEALVSAATKFNDKLASMAMDRFMGAMMTGQDPFAAMFSNGRTGGAGGGAGGVFSMSPTRFFNSIQNAVSGGTNDGLTSFSGASQGGGLEGGAGGSSFGSMAGGGLMAGASILGAYGAGQQGGAIYGGISGAMSGAMAGSMILPGIGTAIGAIVGGLTGAISGALKGSSERNKARDEWRLGEPERALWVSQLKGEVKGSLATTFATEEQKVLKLSQDAWFARQDPSVWKEYSDSFGQFRINNSKRFMEPFQQMLAALEAGLGSNSPVAQAHSAVASLREEMLKFVSDAATAAQYLDRDVAAYTKQAQQAAQAYALSLLTGAEEQTKVRQEWDRINQTAVSLQTVLVDLGMSAEGAATAIQDKLNQAIGKLRSDAEEDMNRRYRSAIGGGYINDVIDAFKKWEDDLKDASTLGIGSDIIDRTNIAEIQKIVTGAKLTQDAFDDLIAGFPKLEGAIRRAASTLEEIAERRLGYLDRYFNATTDTSTLDGQLLAFERAAARDREAEIKAGGEAMAELESALAVERLKIVQDFGKQQQKVLEQAQEAYLSFVRRIKEYTDGLRAGAQSPLSPQARLAAAQSQYDAQLALAQGGNRDALNGITSYSSDLLEAAKAYYASSTAYQAIWSATVGQLEALPTQVSAEQFIVDAINATSANQISALETMKLTLNASIGTGSASAIAASLSAYFLKLDQNTDGAIDYTEMVAALGSNFSSGTWAGIKQRLDLNLDGKISRLETAIYAGTATQIANALSGYFANVQTAAASGITQAQFYAIMDAQGLAKNYNLDRLFSEIDYNDDRLISKEEAIRLENEATKYYTSVAANNTGSTASGAWSTKDSVNLARNEIGYSNQLLAFLQRLDQIAADGFATSARTNDVKNSTNNISTYTGAMRSMMSLQNNNWGKQVYLQAYATGGWVGGNLHSAGGTRIEAERGEYVINRMAAQALRPWMDTINQGRLPVMPVPYGAGNDNGSMREMVAELRALRREVVELRESNARLTVAAAEHVAGHVDGVTESVRDGARAKALLAS